MLNVRIVDKQFVAEDVCSFDFANADGTTLPSFTPGAHIDVYLTGGLIRQYSLCNEPRETHRYTIGVLKAADSRGGSTAMHDLEIGTEIQIGEPRNLFELSREGEHSILVAGGIGITPLLCMAEHLQASGKSFELHYCARSSSKMAFAERLKNSSFAHHLFRHLDDGPVGERFDATRTFSRHGGESVHVYVCGPSGFIDYVLSAARTAGYGERQLHREHFGPVARAIDEEDGPFKVKIASTGEVYSIEAGETVVSALARCGVDIATSCEQGICGTCLTGIVEGVPLHRDMFLTEEERGANNQFTPCCSRSVSSLLVLDL